MGSRKEQTKDIPYTFPKYWNSHAFEKIIFSKTIYIYI